MRYERGQSVREGGGLKAGCERSPMDKEREKQCRGKRLRDETGRLLLVARNNNMRVSLGKLRNFSGGNASET